MQLTSFWKKLARRMSLRSGMLEPRLRRGLGERRLLLESLERRTLLATITVTSLDDVVGTDGVVTLREAIVAANTNASLDGSAAGQAAPVVDTIVFTPGLVGTISLGAGGQLPITETVRIQGNGAAQTIIDAQQKSRVFDIAAISGAVTLDGLTIRNGQMTADFQDGDGGGIRSLTAAALTILDCTLVNNVITGSDAFGGAISAQSDITITNSAISNNSAAGSGGGIRSEGSIAVAGSTISNNTAGPSGGGLSVSDTVVLIGSTVSGNFTAQIGGGIDAGAVTAINSTIFGNTAGGDGGGLFSLTSVTLRNSIVAGNTDASDGSSADIRTFGLMTAQSSLVGDNSSTNLAAAPLGAPDLNGNLIGTHDAPIDPQLGPLASHGGPTQTHALLPGSPAINAGNNALAKTAGPNGTLGDSDDVLLTTDQHGVDRIVGGIVDIGAFELVFNSPPSCAIGPPQNTTDENGPQTVPSWVIHCSANDPGQTASFSIVTDKPELFTAVPAVDAAGTLTYDPAPNARGTAAVTITIRDNGGTVSGGVDQTQVVRSFDVLKPHPWRNSNNRWDVNDDTHVVADDVLTIINRINSSGSGKLLARTSVSQPYYDTDGDEEVTASDVLAVINWINAGLDAEAVGDWIASLPPAERGSDFGLDELLLLMAMDVAGQPQRGRRGD